MSISTPEVKASNFYAYILKSTFSNTTYSNVKSSAPHQPLYRLQPFSEFLWVQFIKGKDVVGGGNRGGSIFSIALVTSMEYIESLSLSPPHILRWFCFDFGSSRKGTQFLFNLKKKKVSCLNSLLIVPSFKYNIV